MSPPEAAVGNRLREKGDFLSDGHDLHEWIKRWEWKKRNLLHGTSLVIADGGVDLGVQASHDVVGRGLLGDNTGLGLQPNIVGLFTK